MMSDYYSSLNFCEFVQQFSQCHIAVELIEPSQNTILIDNIFQNQVIIRRILENLSNDGMTQLRLRLINRSFDSAVLHRICKEHREVSISGPTESEIEKYSDSSDDGHEYVDTVKINKQNVTIDNVGLYFRFLKSVAGVKVRKLTISESSFEFCRETLHNDIVNVLIGRDYKYMKEFFGMQYLCDESCWKCGDIAKSSKKYGPLQKDLLKLFMEEPKHFETLQVLDSYLFELSDHCVLYCDTEKDVAEMLDIYITPLLSCDNMTLILTKNSATSRYSEIGGSGGKLSHCFPREILDSMIIKWKIKSVNLEFRESSFEEKMHYDSWDLFSKACFDVPFEHNQVTNKYFLESVEVDLKFISDIFDTLENFLNADCLNNLVANVRRIIPTNNITVKFPKEVWIMDSSNLDKIAPKLMTIAERDPKRNSKIKFQLYLISCKENAKIPEVFNSGARLLNDNIPLVNYTSLHDIVDVFEESLVGKSFKLDNQMTNNSIDFDVFFEKDILNDFFKTRKNATGYLRHFWNLKE